MHVAYTRDFSTNKLAAFIVPPELDMLNEKDRLFVIVETMNSIGSERCLILLDCERDPEDFNKTWEKEEVA